MKYVQIEPAANTPRSHGGKVIIIECGLPFEKQPARFFLHEGAVEYIPAWAAAELQARGHTIIAAVEIVDEVLDGVVKRVQRDIDISQIGGLDIEAEIAEAPDNEVEKFLRHHGYHDHIMPLPSEAKVETNVKSGQAAGLGHRLRSAADAPPSLRDKAMALHRELGAQRMTHALAAKSEKRSKAT